jgi:hypothetical protein
MESSEILTIIDWNEMEDDIDHEAFDDQCDRVELLKNQHSSQVFYSTRIYYYITNGDILLTNNI